MMPLCASIWSVIPCKQTIESECYVMNRFYDNYAVKYLDALVEISRLLLVVLEVGSQTTDLLLLVANGLVE